jgi:hypothetical protein
MPPDSSCGSRFSNPDRPTSSSSSWARSLYSLRPVSSPEISTGSITFDSTERHGSSAGRWNMNDTSRRGPATGSPATVTAPYVGGSSPAISRRSVDLPHPDRPISVTNSFCRTCRSIASSAWTWPPRPSKT